MPGELLSAVGAGICVRRVGAGDGLIFEDGFLLSPRWPVTGGMALVCGGDVTYVTWLWVVRGCGWWFETDLAIAARALVREGEKAVCVPKSALLP